MSKNDFDEGTIEARVLLLFLKQVRTKGTYRKFLERTRLNPWTHPDVISIIFIILVCVTLGRVLM